MNQHRLENLSKANQARQQQFANKSRINKYAQLQQENVRLRNDLEQAYTTIANLQSQLIQQNTIRSLCNCLVNRITYQTQLAQVK